MDGPKKEEHPGPPAAAQLKRKLPVLAGLQGNVGKEESHVTRFASDVEEERRLSLEQAGSIHDSGDEEPEHTPFKREAHRFKTNELGLPWTSWASEDQSCGSAADEEVMSEVNVDRLLENDVSKALVQASERRSSRSHSSHNLESFLTSLGFQVRDEMEVREFNGERLSVSSNRRNSWIMLERKGSQDTTGEGEPDEERFLVQEIFGPPTEHGGCIQPNHLALTRIVKHVFGLHEAIAREASSVTSGVLLHKSTRSDLMEKTWRFGRYLRKPAGALVKRTWFSVFFTFLTFYALVGMDLYHAVGNSDHEFPFIVINTAVFLLFANELVLYSLGVKGYLYTMPFVLDALAVASMFGDTWFASGEIFGEEAAGVMRMARSSRVARLARLARIARFTRMIPQVMMCNKASQLRIAKEAFLRRLWRIFLFLDAERKGSISVFDFKCIYLTLLQNHTVFSEKKVRVKCLEEDLRWFNSTFNLGTEVWLTWDDVAHKFLLTRVGKGILIRDAEALDSDEGVWRLTRKIGDRSALKISIIILMLLGALSIFDADQDRATVASLGLAELDFIARREHARGPRINITGLCDDISQFRQRYNVVFLHLNGYVRWEDGRCADPNVTSTSPFQRIDGIIVDSKLRNEDYMVVCAPTAEVCSKQQNMSSVCLIDDSSHSRRSAWLVLLSTVLVIALLLMFISTMNAKMGTFTKALLNPLCSLLDDMNVLSELELANVDEDMPPMGLEPVKIAQELMAVQESFRSLRSAIRSWSKYVPPSVVQRLFSAGLEAQIGVSDITATILFCDLIGFEEACIGLQPKEVLLVLSTALGTISEVIERYRGTLLEFIGDEVLAVFNAPNKLKHHMYAGTMAALDIHLATSELPPFTSKKGQEMSVRCRCGVHSAAILAGNIGSHQRMKYGLLGDGINLTARLKTLNSRYDTQTLVSDKIVKDDYCMRRVCARPVDIVAVKGKKKPTVVYEVVGPDSPEVIKAVERHKEAFSLYQEQRFAEAEVVFAEVQQTFGEADGPSSLLMSRCARYAKTPPPPDWDGVERLNAKTF